MVEGQRVGAYWPLPDGRCRFSFPVAAAEEHKPDPARLKALLASRAPWFTGKVGGIEWTRASACSSGSSRRRSARGGSGWRATPPT